MSRHALSRLLVVCCLLLPFTILLTPTLIAQGNSEPPWNPVPVSPPAMIYQPPPDADDLNDFLPPGYTYINATTVPTPTIPSTLTLPPSLPGGGHGPLSTLTAPPATVILPPGTATPGEPTAVPTGTVPATVTPPPNSTVVTLPQQGGGILFADQQVAVVVEDPTFNQTTNFTFADIPAPVYPITLTNTISNPAHTRTLLSFHLETATTTGQVIPTFSHPVRLIVDLRELTPELNPVYSDYWLAYRDPADPNVWHEVPISVHQPDGLISAEVMHFSEWASGARPQRWNPSWNPPTVSEFSGAATFSYPIDLPPGRHGLQPAVALSYSSRGLDGRIQDVDQGIVADGWSLAEISVVRDDVRLKNDTGIPYTHMQHRFRLVLNGTGHQLIVGGTAKWGGTRFYAVDAPDLYIELHDITEEDSYRQRLYWSVMTADGVYYRLGDEESAEESQHVNNPARLVLEGDSPVINPTWAGIAWHVDLVVDPFGNQMTYTYYTRDELETIDYYSNGWHDYILTTTMNRIENINYNYQGQAAAEYLPPNPDTPYPTGNPGSRIAFRARNDNQWWHATDPVTNIFVFHGDLTTPIKEYRLDVEGLQVLSNACEDEDGEPDGPRASTTHVLNSITLFTGTNGNPDDNDAGYALPAVTFSYDDFPHFLEGSSPCFSFYYLTGYQNGYGGSVTFTYTSDNRQVGNYTTPDESCQPYPNCWLPYGQYEWPDIGFNYFVTAMTQNDGRDISPPIATDTTTTYSYETPCYYQASNDPAKLGDLDGAHRCSMPYGEWDHLPDVSNLTGFAVTTVTQKGFADEYLTQRITTFSQDYHHSGQVVESQNHVWNSTLSQFQLAQETLNTLTHDSLGGSLYFSYVSASELYQYDPNNNSYYLATKHVNEYNSTYQDGQQWGRLTKQDLYTWANNTWTFQQRQATRYRTRTTGNYWLILPYSQGIYTSGNTAKQLTLFYYDDATNNPDTQTLDKGRLTLSRSVLIDNPIPPYSDRWYTSDTRMAYDSYGNVTTTKTNPSKGQVGLNGSLWSYSVLADSNTEQTTTISYETTYHLYSISVSNALNQTTTFQIYGFNGVGLSGFQLQRGLLKAVVNANGTETRYEYDPFGRLHAIFDNEDFTGFGDTTLFNGNPVTLYRYWDTTWNHSTTWLNPAANTPFAISEHTRHGTFNGQGGQPMFKLFTYFDGLGRTLQTQNRGVTIDGIGLRDTVSVTSYNALGLAACVSAPFDKVHEPDSHDPAYSTTACTSVDRTTTVYDNLGRMTSVTPPSGNATTYAYEITNFVTVDGYTNLSLTRTYDPKGYMSSQFSNSLGQLVLVRDYTGTSSPYTGYSDTRYTYDILSNLRYVRTSTPNNSQPSSFLRTVEMEYDAFGRKMAMHDPDMGDWSYDYDMLGNLTRQTDEKGQVLCFYYDSLNRIWRKIQDSTPGDACPTYANTPTSGMYHLASYAYDTHATITYPYGVGQPVEVKWGSTPTSNKDLFHYDNRGRLDSQTRTIDGLAFTMTTLTWDVLNRPLTVRTPHLIGFNYEVVTLSYDHEGENTLKAGSDDLVQAVGYNERGQLTTLDRKNGFDSAYSYYDLTGGSGTGMNDGRLWMIQHGTALDALPDFKYFYDKAGNIDKLETYLKPGSTLYIDTQLFGYDHLHRLTSASGSGASAVGIPIYSHTYGYADDATNHNGLLGNLTSYAGSSYDYDTWHTNCGTPPQQDLPHAVHKVGTSDYFCYDGNGNMTIRKSGTVTYTQSFDVENRLTQVTQSNNNTVTRFSYDAGGQRTKTEVEIPSDSKTTTYYPFPNYEQEVRQNWEWCEECADGGAWVWVTTATIKRSTYHLAGQAIATRIAGDPETGNNGLFYFLVDHLGSTTLMVTTAGVIMSTAYFLPFGSYRSTPPPGELTDTGFTGHKHNGSVGLIYMNARYYVPAINRFLTADTLVPGPTNPQAYNRYSYVLGNPLRLVDPSGHGQCDSDDNCQSQPYTPAPPPPPPVPTGPLVTFSVVEDCNSTISGACSWSVEEMHTIIMSAMATGARLAEALNAEHPGWHLSAHEAFLLVYGGSVNFQKMGVACAEGCWGRSTGRNNIDVYDNIFDGTNNQLVGDEHWAVHELGHSFVNAVGWKIPSLVRNWQSVGLLPDRPDGVRRDYKGGFAGGRWEWQRSSSGLASEEFADMFLGWVYGAWETEDSSSALTTDGQQLSDFMNTWMPGFADRAVSR